LCKKDDPSCEPGIFAIPCLLYNRVQIAIIFPREQLNTATNVKHKHNSNYKPHSDDQLRFKGSLHMNIRKYHWQP